MKYIALLITFAIAALAGEKTTTVGPWTRTDAINPMDGTRKITITTKTIDDPGDELVIRYRGKKLEIYLDTDHTVA